MVLERWRKAYPGDLIVCRHVQKLSFPLDWCEGGIVHMQQRQVMHVVAVLHLDVWLRKEREEVDILHEHQVYSLEVGTTSGYS